MGDKEIQDTYEADDIKSAAFKEQAVKSMRGFFKRYAQMVSLRYNESQK